MVYNKRLYHIDYLRAFAVLLVVMFHVSITFMVKAPAWWYVKSADQSIVFTLFVILTDTFMMPLLFLIAGFALCLQLQKKNIKNIIADRIRKLCIPWVVFTLAFAPVLSLFIANTLGRKISYTEMITHYYWTDLYSQGPYWFLGILLLFTFIVIMALRIFGKLKYCGSSHKAIVLLMLLIVPIIFYPAGAYIYGVDAWVNPLYVFSFQPSRIMTYLAYFLAGYMLSKWNWNFRVNRVFWGIIAIVSAISFVVAKGRFENATDYMAYFVQGVFCSAFALSMTMLLLAGFAGIFTKKNSVLTFLSKHSFAVYLLHLPIMVLIAGPVLKAHTGIFISWASIVMIVILLSILLSVVAGKLKRTKVTHTPD